MSRHAPEVPRCGPFVPDPAVPPDYTGRRACLNCHVMGRPGDTHHPDVPEQAQVRHRYNPEED